MSWIILAPLCIFWIRHLNENRGERRSRYQWLGLLGPLLGVGTAYLLIKRADRRKAAGL